MQLINLPHQLVCHRLHLTPPTPLTSNHHLNNRSIRKTRLVIPSLNPITRQATRGDAGHSDDDGDNRSRSSVSDGFEDDLLAL